MQLARADVGSTTFPCCSAMESPVRLNSACSGTAPRGIQPVPSCKYRSGAVSGVGALLCCSGSEGREAAAPGAAGEGAELGLIKAHVSSMRAPARAP